MTDEQASRSLARWLRSRASPNQKGIFAWVVVKRLFSCGCTSANEWCVKYGLDPDLILRMPTRVYWEN